MRNLIIFLFLSANWSFGQEMLEFLSFENYSNNTLFPVKELNFYEGETAHLFSNEEIGNELLYPGTCVDISSVLYDFLLEKDIVSGYVDLYKKEKLVKDKYYITKNEFLSNSKNTLKMYYKGEIKHGLSFRSHMVCIYNKTLSSKYKKDFLINTKDGRLASIVLVADIYVSEFGYKKFTKYLDNGNFSHHMQTLYNDVQNAKIKDPIPIEFRINSQGHVVQN